MSSVHLKTGENIILFILTFLAEFRAKGYLKETFLSLAWGRPEKRPAGHRTEAESTISQVTQRLTHLTTLTGIL